MNCKQCGKEISKREGFCTQCGAYQYKSNVLAEVLFEPLLKIFAFVCALAFLYGLIRDIEYCIASLNAILQYGLVDTVFIAVFALCAIVAGLWMALVLLLIAFRCTPRNAPSLIFGLISGGMVMIVIRLLLLGLSLEDSLWSHSFKNFLYLTTERLIDEHLLAITIVFVCIVGVYLLLFIMRQAPKFRSLMRDGSSKLSEIYDMSIGFLSKNLKKQKAKEEHIADDSATEEHIADDSSTNNHVTSTPKQLIKTDRSFPVYIILNFITFGIYGWFYVYSLTSDLNVMCQDDKQRKESLLAFTLLNLVTCNFYSIYWVYHLANRLTANAPRYGLNFKQKGKTILVCYLAGFLICWIVLELLRLIDWNMILTSLSISDETFIFLWLLGMYYGMAILFCLYPFVAMYVLIKNTNTLATAYNRSNIDVENLGQSKS